MSGRVGSAMSKLCMVENVGVAFGIVWRSVSVQKLFFTSGLNFRFCGRLVFPMRPMSDRVGSAISKLSMVETVA